MHGIVRTLAAVAGVTFAMASPAAEPAWVAESNANAQPLLEIIAKYSPESAAALGVGGHDADILDLGPDNDTRLEADLERAARDLEARLAATQDPRVRQDLQILMDAAHDQSRTSALNRRLMLPYFDVTGMLSSAASTRCSTRASPTTATRPPWPGCTSTPAARPASGRSPSWRGSGRRSDSASRG